MNVCVSHFVWLKCDGFRCFADNITRVSRPTGGAPALSEPDFDVLLGHIMSFGTVSVEYYWIVNIYRNSAWLFTLNF